MLPSTTILRRSADLAGAVGSSLCALHCAILPLGLVLGTTVPLTLMQDEAFHLGLLCLVLPAGIVAFGLGCRQHRDRWVMGLGAAGMLGILLAATLLHDLVGESGERAATLVAAGALIAAHVRNYRLCRTSHCDHDEGVPE
jgi:hypothetical protein